MATSRTEAQAASVLAASEACAALFIARGTTALTVDEITRAIGIPVRTFHRYFPTKADAVAPLFEWTTATFNAAVAASPADMPLRKVLARGFELMLGGDLTARTRALFPLVFDNPQMWAVFLRGVHFGEISLAPILAARMALPSDAIEARAAAAVVASATRIALEAMVADGADPYETFVRLLEVFDGPTLHAEHPA